MGDLRGSILVLPRQDRKFLDSLTSTAANTLVHIRGDPPMLFLQTHAQIYSTREQASLTDPSLHLHRRCCTPRAAGGGEGDCDHALLERPISAQTWWTLSSMSKPLACGNCVSGAAAPSLCWDALKALPSSESACTILPLGSCTSSILSPASCMVSPPVTRVVSFFPTNEGAGASWTEPAVRLDRFVWPR